MSGKHSKNFFDFKKSSYVTAPKSNRTPSSVALPIKIITVVVVCALVLISVFVGDFFVSSVFHKKLLTDAANVFDAKKSGQSINTLAEQNPDIKGWLKIPDTQINCAVCQSDNDSFYIDHNQSGKKSRYGALFLSAKDSFERGGNDHNIMIFGNNMLDGTMFGGLKEYRKLSFYKQNPFIELYYANQNEKYIVFSVMLISSSKDDNNTSYRVDKGHFANQDEFNQWLLETRSRSIISTPVDVQFGDDILTLVTVADDFEGARLAVLAKKVTAWEAEHTDVLKSTVNYPIKYPKIWYAERDLDYPY